MQPPPLPGEYANHVSQENIVIQRQGNMGNMGTVQQLRYAQQSQQGQSQSQQLTAYNQPTANPVHVLAKKRASEKALTFFQSCLKVLNIEEEVALTDEVLRAAYKKVVVRAHPDRGGSEEQFEAVTRAYAYLTDILHLIQGQKGRTSKPVPALEKVQEERKAQAAQVAYVEPVRLNPKNLNMNAFNQMFEQTRVPDPDEDGYGDWLKDEANAREKGSKKGAKKFSEDFNREVFNRMFEEEHYGHGETAIQKFQHPQEMILNVSYGVELGRDRPGDYTAAPGSKQQFTDLRAAYTRENTVSNQVHNVHVENRDFNSYKSQRERAPDAYNPAEMAALQAYENQQKRREDQRRLRAAQEQHVAQDYFERMKQLVITEK
jgi:curved DNA-binding protein CbpA